jgi:hypothetical protein
MITHSSIISILRLFDWIEGTDLPLGEGEGVQNGRRIETTRPAISGERVGME